MPHFSIKEPIKNYNIPKTDDVQAVTWLANWLNNRREQLHNNMNDTHIKRLQNLNNGNYSGYGAEMYGYLNYIRGYSPERLYTNGAFYTEVENAAGAKNSNTRFGGTEGGYNRKTREISINNNNDMGTRIHERTHAMNAKPQEEKVRQLLKENTFKFKPNPKTGGYDVRMAKQGYYYDPSEVYSRMNEFRYNQKLKPEQIIDKEYLNSNRKALREHSLDIIDDDTLIKLLNEVAINTNNNRYSLEDIYYG